MADETPKITSTVKEKNPKRVEAGKRLAAISKEAKEKKMREKIEEEITQKEKEKEKESSWNIDYKYLIGVVVLFILYFTYSKSNDTKKESNNTYSNERPFSPHKNDTKIEGPHKNEEEPSFKFDTLD